MRRGGGVGNSSSLRLHDHTGLQRFFSISATLNPYVVARGGSVSTSYLSASSRSSSLDSPVTCGFASGSESGYAVSSSRKRKYWCICWWRCGGAMASTFL